jgi:FkbM family methyltransferase
MISQLFYIQRFILLHARLKNYNAAKALASYNGNNQYVIKINGAYCKGNQIHSRTKQVSVPIEKLHFFRNDLKFAFDFVSNFDVKWNEDEVLMVGIKGKNTQIKAHSFETVFAIYEVFIEDFYDISLNDEVVVVDVGMNVGVASLYFALMDNVKKVYGFEPFEGTFNLAKANFELNSHLKNKIIAENVGLGKENATITIPLIQEGSLGGSTTDFHIDAYKDLHSGQLVKVNVKNIQQIINQIVELHPKQKILLKLDCEGAEYDIIEVLDEVKLLKAIHFCVIEWHIKGKSPLVQPLIRNGFNVIAPNRLDSRYPLGFIYAYQ